MLFSNLFYSLTGFKPLLWQQRLFDLFCKGEFPGFIDLPTGIGKTSTIPIWLLSLYHVTAEQKKNIVPRRLIFVVNRRAVADSISDLVLDFRHKINTTSELKIVKEVFQSLSAFTDLESFLNISTLRGAKADDGQWKSDPCCPAIVIGTVDKIGSSLLFSGYGLSKYSKPFHAGLLGYDSLIIHDEAHLVPAFEELLLNIQSLQGKYLLRNKQYEYLAHPYASFSSADRPFHVINMSATMKAEKGLAFSLDDKEREEFEVKKRMYSRKFLIIESSENISNSISEQALRFKDSKKRILIYVQSPDDAIKIKKEIDKASAGRTVLIIGPMRGYEREKILKSSAMQQFFGKEKNDETVWAICTSAGEVGIDIDADDLVCDLAPLPNLIQRFGRVNRKGNTQSKIYLYYSNKESEATLKKTLIALKQLPLTDKEESYVASPAALTTLMQKESSLLHFNRPAILPLTDSQVASWSLTSFTNPLMMQPPVHQWLHGFDYNKAYFPEVKVCWRKDVDILDKYFLRNEIDVDVIERILEVFPILPHEVVRDTLSKVEELLKAINTQSKNTCFIRVGQSIDIFHIGNNVEIGSILKKLKDEDTLILPESAGGLNESGCLDNKCQRFPLDVSEAMNNENDPENYRARLIIGVEQKADEISRIKLDSLIQRLKISPSRLFSEKEERVLEEGTEVRIEYYKGVKNKKKKRSNVSLEDHTGNVQKAVKLITEKLSLSDSIKNSFDAAAQYHDKGKEHPVWKRAAYGGRSDINSLPSLAKSDQFLSSFLKGFRHEFSSFQKAQNEIDLTLEFNKDLCYHLIASHHGYSRPHFPLSCFDASSFKKEFQSALDCIKRFSKLQRILGPWKLAWLEALFKSADIHISQKEDVE